MAEGNGLASLLRPAWSPTAQIERGWLELDADERREVAARLEAVLENHCWGDHAPDALQHCFAFLAQVETIAIEIPLRFLGEAPPHLRPALRRQLVDEVFHSVLFCRLAHDLSAPAACPPAPIASAERLLQQIRDQDDMQVAAALLNLVAEGWIENLFRHARRWGIANAVFDAVLADEARHVHEAADYLEGFDASRARGPLADLEAGLLDVSAEPTVALSLLDLAGDEAYRDLVVDLHRVHREHLAEVGLEPSPAWQEAEAFALDAALGTAAAPARSIVQDTAWRRTARTVWHEPRDPTMRGEADVAVGHFRRKLTTPIMVAAVARAWAANPRLNRVISRGKQWQLADINVGLRVMVGDGDLATVVIPEAHRRSIRDISRMIQDGVAQLEAVAARSQPGSPVDHAGLLPPHAHSFSVAVSNPGQFGLQRGSGALSGHLAPTTDITVGQRRKLPLWRGIMYVPAAHVTLGCLQDHRVFDGREAGEAMQAIREQLSRRGVRAILATPDSLPADAPPARYDDAWFDALPPQLRLASTVGFGKFTAFAVGGVGIAGAGIAAGYMLVQNLAAQQAAAAAASVAGGAGTAGGAAAGSADAAPLAQPPSVDEPQRPPEDDGLPDDEPEAAT